ncbi:MAG: hypothetical protein RMK35_05860 [Aquificaceae bacterium]|nr:hypothetical protein [Aquificaceae bacterium]MDW8434313.1 hypothetical protein [Aquificaceae bacterium]
MLSKLFFAVLWGLFAPFLFSCERVREIDPAELSRLYYEHVLTFSTGMEGCVDFVKKYGFYSVAGDKRRHDAKTARSACEKAQKDKVVRWSYEVEKLYRNEELGRANYELVLMVGGVTPYRRNIGFEKVGGIWRFYISQ